MCKSITVFLALTFSTMFADDHLSLFFSEYAEGSGSNKYIEIYNGTGEDVDLSNYYIFQNANGGPLDEYVDQLEGVLAHGDVYVIANNQSNETILAGADLTGSGICFYNGDDARALGTIVGEDTTIIDVIGAFPDDPGDAWDVAGIEDGTRDKTLVRKSFVRHGNNDWAASAGTNVDDSEWIVQPRPTADYTPSTFGSHLNDVCENPNLAVTVEMFDSYSDGWNGATYTIYGPGGAVEASGGLVAGGFAVDTVCLYQYNSFSIVVGGGAWDSEISFNVVDAFGNVLYSGFADLEAHVFAVSGVNEVVGCTDPAAVNYDPDADADNGTCYYEGDICEVPIVLAPETDIDGNPGAFGIADANFEQWFSYTAQQTGNLTVTSAGLTTNDTYVSVLIGCTIDSTLNEDGSYSYFYADEIAYNDDIDLSGGVYQSEATVCVTAGQTILIAWLPLYYPYESSFQFAVYETPDVTTPVNVAASGFESGIGVSWDPIPGGCASESASARIGRANNLNSKYVPIITKNGDIVEIKPKSILEAPKQPENNSSRSNVYDFTISNTQKRSLDRDCADGTTEVSFVSVCGGFNCYEGEQSYTVVGSDGTVYISAAETDGATYTPIPVCLADGEYTVTLFDSFGDGWNSGVLNALVGGSAVYTLTMTSVTGDPAGEEITGTFTLNSSAVFGCTDQLALNYDPSATDDNGTCVYTGDLCDSPVIITDAVTGVESGDASWYSIDIPSDPGALTISNTGGFGSVLLYGACGTPQFFADFFSSGEVQTFDFSSASTDDNGNETSVYLGTTIYLSSNTSSLSFSYEVYNYGCTDPNASNYDETANADDGSCECASTVLTMTMTDSYNDSWNGNTYAVVDASGAIVASGTMPSVIGPYSESFCMPADGTYSLFVASPPAEGGSSGFPNYVGEIGWVLSSAETGQVILSGGGEPFGADGGNTFPLPLPEFTFSVYRDGSLLVDDLTVNSYFDSTEVQGSTNLVGGQPYCYTVTQTDGVGANAVTSEQSEPDCAEIYVPSSCATALTADLDTVNYIDGLGGRDEWFYHIATQDGFLTVTSDIPGNTPDNDTRLYLYGGECENLVLLATHDDVSYPSNPQSIATIPVFAGDRITILWNNMYNPGPSVWTLFEVPAGVRPPSEFEAEPDHERVHLSWMYPLTPLNEALSARSPNGSSIEENTRNISRGTHNLEKNQALRREVANSLNGSNSREIDFTSSIGVVGSILKDDGTADIVINFDVQSSDNSWADAVRYTFPPGIIINSALDASESMRDAENCILTIDNDANTVTFGDGVWIADSTTGSELGCLQLLVHQHIINVNAFTEEIEIGFYAADDCWGACPGDFSGTMAVPVPEDNPCFDDELEEDYDHLFGFPDTYTPLSFGLNSYPDLTICPEDEDVFSVNDFSYGGVIDIRLVDKSSSGTMQVFFWDLARSEVPIFGTNSTASGDTILFSYQNRGLAFDGTVQTGQSTDLVIWVVGNSPLAQNEYSLSIDVRPPEQYMYNIYDATTDAVIEDSIIGYNYVHSGLVNGSEYQYYAKTMNEIGHMSPPSVVQVATPVADILNPPRNLVGESTMLSRVDLTWEVPLSSTPGEYIETAYPIDMLPFSATGSTGGFADDYDVQCTASSTSPDVVFSYTATEDTIISLNTCLSSYDTKIYVYDSDNQVVGCDDDSWGNADPVCFAWTSYIDSVSVFAGRTYYIVVDGFGGEAGLYQLDVRYLDDPDNVGPLASSLLSQGINNDALAKAQAYTESEENRQSMSRALNSYEIYRDGVVVGTTEGLVYADSNLVTSADDGISYSYYVKAVYDGGTSEASNTVSVTPIHPVDVPEPVNVLTSSNGWVVDISWDSPDVGPGDTLFSESFNDGTLGEMTSEDLTGGSGTIFLAGNNVDASSEWFTIPDIGSQFAYFNDDALGQGGISNAVLSSGPVDVSALSAGELSDLSLVGNLFFPQPSGDCLGGSTYGEDLLYVFKIDGGTEWLGGYPISSTTGWETVIFPLNEIPFGTQTVEVGIVYSDCGGQWGYGVAVDDFKLMVPPELVLLGFNVFKDGSPYTSVGAFGMNHLIDVVNQEGSYTYAVSAVYDFFGESERVSSTVDVTAPVGPMIYPPRDLTVTPDGLAADIEWKAPAGVDGWVAYNSGYPGNFIGNDEGFDATYVIRIPAEDLIPYQGKVLEDIAFAGGQGIATTAYQAVVFKASPNSLNPEPIYASDPIPGSEIDPETWNFYTFENPIPVPPLGEELWFGLRVIFTGDDSDGSYPVVVDDAMETFDGISNLVNGFGSDGWTTLLELGGFQGNLMIEGWMAHPTPNLAVNGSFEAWYQDGGWQHFPSDFVRIGSDGAPYGNMFVDADGAGINGAPEGVALEVLDGQHSLKMWGMYAGGQDMWGSVYQTHSVESLGGVGSMFEAHVGVMSHEYDWIGTGTNYTTIFAEYYSVDDLGVVTYIDTIESNPFDGTFAASVWHEIGLDGVIPDGATHVDIGVIFYQENNDQNGSVYYDDLNIRHYGHDIYPDPQALALQVNKRDMTQINGYNLRTAIPMGYFEEYIPTNTSRNHDMVMMGYKLYRDNVAIDTLDIESDYYYDMVGVEGMYEYAISAMYHDVDQGSMEEAMSQMVMGNLTNNAPTIPTLLLPLDNTTITLSDENVVTDELVIQWDPATDTDLDLVEYTLQLCIDGQDICIDTNTVETYVFIPYSYLYDVITDLGVNVLNVTWSVHASDGWETVSSLSRSLVVDAGWMLSADEDLLPKVFALHNNYPNPFNPITNISYDIPELSNVRIEIFNLAGQKVRTLVSKQHQPGRYKVQWNATNQFGAPVSSGMYIYKIHAKGFSDVKKLLLMK